MHISMSIVLEVCVALDEEHRLDQNSRRVCATDVELEGVLRSNHATLQPSPPILKIWLYKCRSCDASANRICSRQRRKIIRKKVRTTEHLGIRSQKDFDSCYEIRGLG